MPDPAVSVILPSYNHEDFVEEAVRSVLDQTFSDLELIVVDDASTDRTADIVAGIQDPRLTLVRNAMNRERHPRNEALRRARGKYIAFQNSDDRWLPEKLEKQLSRLEADPRIVGVFTDIQHIDERGRRRPARFSPPYTGLVDRHAALRHTFLSGNCFDISSAVIPADTLRRVGGFNPFMMQTGDQDLWVRLLVVGNVEVLPEKLLELRTVGLDGNLSGRRVGSVRRTRLEYQALWRHYAEAPIVLELEKIFPEEAAALDPDADVSTRRLFLAWIASRQKGRLHRIFAANLMLETGGALSGADNISLPFTDNVLRDYLDLASAIPDYREERSFATLRRPFRWARYYIRSFWAPED